MTERFKEAVKGVVADGIVTEDEQRLLVKIAKEENISETDAIAYFIQEAKKRKAKINGKDAWEYAKDIFSGLGKFIVIVGGIATSVISVISFLDSRKNNNKK